jgi:hypothetical protein
VQHVRHAFSLTCALSICFSATVASCAQDVGDKAKDAANQTEGAIKDAAGAVKGKVSQQLPCSNGDMCGMSGLLLPLCCPAQM